MFKKKISRRKTNRKEIEEMIKNEKEERRKLVWNRTKTVA